MRTKYRHQGRVKYWQHGPSMFCIYRTLIQQRLLVKFSCEFPHHTSLEIYSLVRSFVLCDKWLPQQQNSTILWDSALHGLLSFLTLLPSSTESRELNIKKKPKPDPRHKGGYQLDRQSLAGRLHTCSHVYIGRITLCGHGRQCYSNRRLVLLVPL